MMTLLLYLTSLHCCVGHHTHKMGGPDNTPGWDRVFLWERRHYFQHKVINNGLFGKLPNRNKFPKRKKKCLFLARSQKETRCRGKNPHSTPNVSSDPRPIYPNAFLQGQRKTCRRLKIIHKRISDVKLQRFGSWRIAWVCRGRGGFARAECLKLPHSFD